MKHTIMLALLAVMAIDVKVVMADDLSHSSREALSVMDQFWKRSTKEISKLGPKP